MTFLTDVGAIRTGDEVDYTLLEAALIALADRGTFTPTLEDESKSAAEGQTYIDQVGLSVATGDMIKCWAEIEWTSLGTLTTTDDVFIGGLPVNVASVRFFDGSVFFHSGLSLPTAGPMTLVGVTGENRCNIYLGDNVATATKLTVGDLSDAGRMLVTMEYVV